MDHALPVGQGGAGPERFAKAWRQPGRALTPTRKQVPPSQRERGTAPRPFRNAPMVARPTPAGEDAGNTEGEGEYTFPLGPAAR
jgi:hypothetical protein